MLNILISTFINIGPKLTSKIPIEQGGFEKYLENCNNIMNDAAVVDELRDAFFTLKTNESPGHDYIFFKAIIIIIIIFFFYFTVEPLRYIFNKPLDKELFRIKPKMQLRPYTKVPIKKTF